VVVCSAKIDSKPLKLLHNGMKSSLWKTSNNFLNAQFNSYNFGAGLNYTIRLKAPEAGSIVWTIADTNKHNPLGNMNPEFTQLLFTPEQRRNRELEDPASKRFPSESVSPLLSLFSFRGAGSPNAQLIVLFAITSDRLLPKNQAQQNTAIPFFRSLQVCRE
jgi:hypothetical protein